VAEPTIGRGEQVVVRSRLSVVVVAAVSVALLLGGAAPGAVATLRSASASAAPGDVVVGSLTLHHCKVVKRALCGSLLRPWDPTGAVTGNIRIGFAFVRAHDRSRSVLGTLVPREGGPGYSTTGSGASYAAMYGPLMERRNLLLVDQRGTGRSQPIDCPELQNPTGPFNYGDAAGRCAQKLGDKANLYGTALSADDLAAVIDALGLGRIDLYGDSYGTFFAAVFAGRHAAMLRSVILDSAYPPTGETAWYPTQGPAMLRSIDLACERTPACAAAGATTSTLLARVLAEVRRKPFHGRAADGVGHRRRVTVDAEALVSVAFGATYGPAVYGELPGALRAALQGYHKPLVRLTAESLFTGPGGDPADYSEGLDAAVSCHDYPQLYDMTATPEVRRAQYADAVRVQIRSNPRIYAPFTVGEYLRSDWEMADWCLNWPVAPAADPAGPPAPPSGSYPPVPTLVLSGELDSITTPAEGSLVAAAFPQARQVIVANSFHVTAMGDTDECAVRIARRFVRHPSTGLTARRLSCANRVAPLRAVADYHRSYLRGSAAHRVSGSASVKALHASASAVRTAGDLLDRWFDNYSGTGHGLHGGNWSYTGDSVVHFTLHKVRLNRNLAVSGHVTWARYRHTVVATVDIRRVRPNGHVVAGASINGQLVARWDSRTLGARAVIDGRLGGHALVARMRAP
jgi:pimeloyl-ACP methyl ester carboxylesterase